MAGDRVSINEFAASGWNSTLVGAITLPITAPVAGIEPSLVFPIF